MSLEVGLHPAAAVLPRWEAASLQPDFAEALPGGEVVREWGLGERVFLAVAMEAFDSKHCRAHFERRPLHWPLPYSMRNDHVRVYNRTALILEMQLAVDPWHAPLNLGIMALVDLALALRVWCSALTLRCAEVLRTWGSGWCLFRRRLAGAAKLLPAAGHLATALGTSAAAVLQEQLPHVLAVPMSGLANGKLRVQEGAMMAENATAIFSEYFEFAIILGQEALRHGQSRVSAAHFHGGASDRSIRSEGAIHRADVLLYALADASRVAPGAGAAAGPLVVELGVDQGECSERLLSGHPTLRWRGVDIYDDSFMDLAGASSRGTSLLLRTRERLKPWLGTRAQLLLSRTVEAAKALCGEPIDLLFVDADHSLAAVAADLAAWVPCVRPGGVIAGHDYHRVFPGVVEAAHAAIPAGTTLHLGPDMVFWWQKPT